jgi:hypothetical protein
MDEAEQKIRFVVTMFRIVAWPLAILLVPASLAAVGFLVFLAIVDVHAVRPMHVVGIACVLPLSYLPVFMLRVASRLKRGDPNALSPAYAAAGMISLLGMPVTILIGIFLIFRIRTYYEPYCRNRELAPVP